MKTMFSIVIPALNEERYLPGLLSDLAEQTFKEFEVIVVDGRSDDMTVSEAKKFVGKLSKLTILSSKKRNVSVQRNMGGKMANSEWIVFMDADDRLQPDFMKILSDVIGKNKSVGIFTCWMDSDSSLRTDKALALMMNVLLEAARIINYKWAPGAMIGIREEGFDMIGGFDPNKDYGEDGHFVREAFRIGFNFFIFKEPKYRFSQRRFRKNGNLKQILIHAKLIAKSMIDIPIDGETEYPKGGSVFENVEIKDEVYKKLFKKFGEVVADPKLFKRLKKRIGNRIFKSNN